MIIISKERIISFQEAILKWFVENGRIFSWRKENATSYELIIAEILLQRTKAETISKFYDHFLTNFPSWQSLVLADLNVIENYLIPIGLYRQRSQRLKKLAQYMVENGNKLPMKREEIEKVPFMGQYIANAVELLIYHRSRPLLDVNMARVLERYFGPRQKADIRYDPYLQNLAYNIAQHTQSKKISWAILDFAAIICQSRIPKCLICSLSNDCKFFNKTINHYI